MSQSRAAIVRGVPLYLASINMRAGLVVISPIITLIGSDLGLGTIQLAWLTSIPVLCFTFASSATTWMRRHASVNQIITGALWVLGASLILRATGSVGALYLFTVGVGVGIATLNVMLPIWVKQHGGDHAGLLTGIYVSMMSVTTSLAIALAVPLALATSLGWQLALLPWGVVSLASAAWWQWHSRGDAPGPRPAKADVDIRMFLHSRLAWQVTLVFGAQSLNAYAARAWVPTIMIDKGFTMAAAGTTVALAGLVGALTSIAVPHWAQRSTDQRPTLWAMAALSIGSYLGIGYGNAHVVIVCVYIANAVQWTIYPLALLLIILRSPDSLQAQSLSAMAQTAGYVLGAIGPLATGALFDATGSWHASLWLMAFAGLLVGLGGAQAGRVGHVRRRDVAGELQAL